MIYPPPPPRPMTITVGSSLGHAPTSTGMVSISKQFFQKPAQPERSELGVSDTRSRGPRSVARDSHIIMNRANAVPRAKPGPMRSLPEGKPGVTGGAELMARESRRFPEMPVLPALVRAPIRSKHSVIRKRIG